MNRRKVLYGGVAAASGLAGVAAAWWKTRSHGAATELAGNGNASLPDPIWDLSFDTPDGQPFAMSLFRGKPLLVNFWATWCPPCVEELPLLSSFYDTNKANNWQVLGLAVDQPSAVRKWLLAKPLSFAVGMAGLNGTALGKSLGNLTGGLPFTAVFDRFGVLKQRKLGKVSPENLKLWAKDYQAG